MEDTSWQEQFSFPVVCMLVEQPFTTGKKNVLLQKRCKPGSAYDGLWEVPQGRISCGESFLDAARRELKEETDLTLDALDASHCRATIKLIESSIESFSPFICVIDPEHNYVGIGVIVSGSGVPATSPEASEHCWVNRGQVATLIAEELVFPLNVPLLKAYFQL